MIHRILIVLVVTIFSVSAFAQEEAVLTYEGKLAAGHNKYLASDYEGALSEYQEAKDMESGNALGYYFVACAQAKLEKYDDSVATFRTASSIAGDKDQSLHAKALFMVAVTEERRASWTAAKAAWNAYLTYANAHEEATTFKAVAEDRIKVIDVSLRLQEEYAGVRAKAPAAKETAATPAVVEAAPASGS